MKREYYESYEFAMYARDAYGKSFVATVYADRIDVETDNCGCMWFRLYKNNGLVTTLPGKRVTLKSKTFNTLKDEYGTWSYGHFWYDYIVG